MHIAKPPSAPWLVSAVREAGSIALQHFQARSYSVETKPDGSPVTTVDKELDRFLREHIQSACPTDGIITEEGAPVPARDDDASLWLVDPIDGTSHFVNGERDFAVLVARCRAGLSVEACLCFPGLDLLISARLTGGCWVNRRRVHASQRALDKARIAARGTRLAQLHTASHESKNAALDIVRVATGELDACVTPVSPQAGEYDYAWAPCVVEEAGGTFTDGAGLPVRFRQGPMPPIIVASNGVCHDALVAHVQAALAQDHSEAD